MNKRATQKAFFVCVFIGIAYAAMAFNIQEKFVMKRTHEVAPRQTPKNLSVAVVKTDFKKTMPESIITNDNLTVEPLLLIAIPIIAASIIDGHVEKEGLILIRNTENPSSPVYLKKPLDILKDKDREGLMSLSKIIGKRQIESLLKKEGVTLPHGLVVSDAIMGQGFKVEKKVLVMMYNKYVSKDLDQFFPFSDGDLEVQKKAGIFTINKVGENRQVSKTQQETAWTMPNLLGLSMKAALDRITPKSKKIKLYGSGIVIDQHPKPSELVRYDTECILYGRSQQR